MALCTERLTLRPWRGDDADSFHTIWGDPQVIWWGATERLEDTADFLDALLDRCAAMPEPCGWFAVAPHGEPIVGNVLLQPAKCLAGEVEVGWHLSRAGQGRGYATEASRLLLTIGFEHFDTERIIAPIIPTNAASQRVATRLGMRPGERIDYAGYPHEVWFIERADHARQSR
jgi:RimJ/RimL family protein N-acetyltransferase